MGELVNLNIEGRIAIIEINSPPVNALSQQVRQGIMAQLQIAIDDEDIEAIVLICAGRTFIAGADIREFGLPPKTPHVAGCSGGTGSQSQTSRGGNPWNGAGWWLRNRTGLPRSCRKGRREGRSAGSQAGSFAGSRWHPTIATPDRRAGRASNDHVRRPDWGRKGCKPGRY